MKASIESEKEAKIQRSKEEMESQIRRIQSNIRTFAVLLPHVMDDTRARFGDDWWPYGIEGSRTTLEAFLQYGYEQGTLHKKMKPEDLFPEEVQHFFKY